VSTLRSRPRLEWLEWAAAAAVLAVGLIEVLGNVYDEHWKGPAPVSAAFVVAMALPLATMRARPVASVLIVAASFGLYCAIWGTPASSAAVFVMILACFGAGRYRGARERLVVAALVAMILAAAIRNDSHSVAVVLFFGGIALAPFAAGRLVANRQRLADRLRAQQPLVARAAVVDERARIARELHDVVAHGVSVMVIQAAAGRTLLRRDPARAAEPFEVIEATGKQALGELRRLLGVLRADDDETGLGLQPQPGLGDLEQLVAGVGESGVRVELIVSGESDGLTPGVDLAAYRIVQEALTNVIRHSGTDRATVRLAFEPGAVSLEILDEGGGKKASPSAGGGHGLPGMRERATLYGGELQAGPREEGGYAVRARLPVEAAG
jgi:signal transduction histidine kinase